MLILSRFSAVFPLIEVLAYKSIPERLRELANRCKSNQGEHTILFSTVQIKLCILTAVLIDSNESSPRNFLLLHLLLSVASYSNVAISHKSLVSLFGRHELLEV